MKILIIDNYDSFTFNLYQCFGEILQDLGKPFSLDVFRNDELSLEEIKKKQYDKIVISPGPGSPSDKSYFGVCSEVILELGKTTPVLGVCLGMQGICHYFGGEVIKAKKPMHGKTSTIVHDEKWLFKGLSQEIEVMRYHSLIANPKNLPECLKITSFVSAGKNQENFSFHNSLSKKYPNLEIMGLRHKKYPIEGIQFHPESFATEAGKEMLKNWIDLKC